MPWLERLHLPGQKILTDYSDGDPDFESPFYILKYTICTASVTWDQVNAKCDATLAVKSLFFLQLFDVLLMGLMSSKLVTSTV